MKITSKILKQVTIVLLLGIVMLAGSCGKINYHQLTDEDMAWLVYKNNEVVVFTNANNESTSFRVTLRTKSYQGSDDNYNEFTTASFQQLNDTAAFDVVDSRGQLYIFKPDDDGLLVTLTWPHYPFQDTPLTSMPYNIVTIDGINYDDVFILDATGATDARYTVEKVWYSQSEGVVQYEDVYGQEWKREN